MAKNPFVSGPGHIGEAQEPPLYVSKADREQQERENDPNNKVKPGQEAFDQAQKDLHSFGRQANIDGGMPEELLDGGFIDPTPLPKYSREAARAMFPADFDSSSVPDKLARMYGLDKSTHVPIWDYCDDNDGKGTSYEAQHFADNPWDEYCLDAEGKKLFRSGYILYKRPIEVADDIQARFNEISVDLKEHAPNENPPLDEHSPETLKKRDEMGRAIEAFLKDSPSRHMGPENLDRAMRTFTPEESEKFRADVRYGRSATVENERDQTAETLKAVAAGRSARAVQGVDIDPATGVITGR